MTAIKWLFVTLLCILFIFTLAVYMAPPIPGSAPIKSWSERNVVRFKDSDNKVTCWANVQGGVFCLPDAALSEGYWNEHQ
jgi:hypothetical protein